ncbi:hypothetical protein ABPG75_004504 [Micractinium tetrahymenae]
MAKVTFSRRGRTQQQEPSPVSISKRQRSPGARDPFEGLLSDPSDPFFFGGPDEEQQEQREARSSVRGRASKSPVSKGTGSSGRQAAAAAGAPLVGGRSPSRARKAGSTPAKTTAPVLEAAAKPAAGKAACKASTVAPVAGARASPGKRQQQQQQPRQQAPARPTASPIAQRNPGANGKQLQQQSKPARQQQQQQPKAQAAEDAARKPSGRSRPSAQSKLALQPVDGFGAAASGGAAGKEGVQVNGQPKATAASSSPGKRKAAGAPEQAPAAKAAAAGTAAAAGKRLAGGKRMRQSKESDAAAAAAPPPGAPATAPAAQRAGASRPSGGRGSGRAAPGSGGSTHLAALRPAALRGQAAATTVMQAQALGEQQSITDDALWALDGLASGSAATARDSLATLGEICASKRGRLALRSGQLAADVLAAAGTLKVSSDPVQALGLATLLLCFCQADADPALLGRQEVAAAAAQLLQLSASLDAASAATPAAGSAAAAKLATVLRERPYSLQLPPEERGSPLSVALAALADVLDPSKSALHADPLKHALRQAGALQAAAQVAADHAGALTDAAPTMQTVRSLWRLHKALHVLESACFACPENEAFLLGASVAVGVPPMVASPGFVGWLVQQLELLSRQALIPGIKKDCLRGLLAVLLNATQNNPAGCAAVVAAGVIQPAAAVLAQIVRGGPKIKGVLAGEGELAAWHDVLSTCMALFINLAEHQPSWRQQLRALQLPDPAPSAAGGSGGRVQLVPLLCSLLAKVATPPGARPGEGTPRAPAVALARRVSLGSGEISADCLALREDLDVKSMAEVYAAVLLGFLIQDCPEARGQAAALLPGRSLDGVAAAVEHALDFYATMGAMTQDNVDNLRGLLASLQPDHQQPSTAGAAAGGAAAAAGAATDGDSPPSPAL